MSVIKTIQGSALANVPRADLYPSGTVFINVVSGDKYTYTHDGLWKIEQSSGNDVSIDQSLKDKLVSLPPFDGLIDGEYILKLDSQAGSHWTRFSGGGSNGSTTAHDPFVLYKPGDFVIYGGAIYMAKPGVQSGTFNPAQWTSLDNTGDVYDAAKTYGLGDIASNAGKIYIANKPTTAGPFAPADWDGLTAIEQGGVKYDATLNYKVGDVATFAGEIYVALTDSTGKQPDISATDWNKSAGANFATHAETKAGTAKDLAVSPDSLRDRLEVVEDHLNLASGPLPTDTHAILSVDPTNKSLELRVDNQTGIEIYDSKAPSTKWTGDEINSIMRKDYIDKGDASKWDATKMYKEGDIVSNTGNLFIRTADATAPEATFDPLLWTSLSLSEQGGVAWSAALNYNAGDMVTQGGVPYTRIAAQTAPETAFDPLLWNEIGGTELGGKAYDITAIYKAGDVVSQADKLYIRTADATAAEDPFVVANWTEATGNSHTLWEPNKDYLLGDIAAFAGRLFYAQVDHTSNTTVPQMDKVNWSEFNPEYRGREFTPNNDYEAGDIVTFGGAAYICISTYTALAVTPDVDITNWSALVPQEVGGVAYSPTVIYTSGDTVIESDIFYRRLADATAVEAVFVPANWEEVSSPERGGVEYDATMLYEIGDIVSQAGVAYRNITAIATAEAFDAAKWESLEVAEQGGVKWSAFTDYKEGDLVGYFGVVYTASVDNINKRPKTNGAEWKSLSSLGKTWDTMRAYDIGDVVSENYALYVAISGTGNIGKPPETDHLYWRKAAIKSAWEVEHVYNTGDLATRSGKIFIALTDNEKGKDPLVDTTAWKEFQSSASGLWSDALAYKIGDTVSFNGLLYVSSTDHVADILSPDLNAGDWDLVTPKLDDTGSADNEVWSSRKIENELKGVSKLLGDWDASTNLPLLADGDSPLTNSYYIVTADGTVDTGAGDIDYVIGDKIVKAADGTWGVAKLSGASAYDSAVAGGYAGTETEWVASLQGVGLNVNAPVDDEADRLVLSAGYTAADVGQAVLQKDTGIFWTWAVSPAVPTGLWVDASNLTGPQGIQGDKGDAGVQGLQGLTGPSGTNGTDGTDGVDGIQGIQGPTGVGINVMPPVADFAARDVLSSTYDETDIGNSVLQLDTGVFYTWSDTGTKAAPVLEWVNASNLQGPQGRAGADGKDGADGAAGIDGIPGRDGTDGLKARVSAGVLYITTDGTNP